MTIKNLPADCLPIIADADFAKVTTDGFSDRIQKKYQDERTPEANAYRKIATMFSASQKGGIGAPKNVTYWAWRSLSDEDELELFKSEARLVISAQEMEAPVFGGDVQGLSDAIEKIEAGEEPNDLDKELLEDCKKLIFKWIDVAVRTKSNRSGLKQVSAA